MSRKSGKGIDKRRRYMSYADKVFIDMCRDIIDNGTSTEGEKVRPVWEDGTSAYTIKRFGVVNRISGVDTAPYSDKKLCGRAALDLAEKIK